MLHVSAPIPSKRKYLSDGPGLRGGRRGSTFWPPCKRLARLNFRMQKIAPIEEDRQRTAKETRLRAVRLEMASALLQLRPDRTCFTSSPKPRLLVPRQVIWSNAKRDTGPRLISSLTCYRTSNAPRGRLIVLSGTQACAQLRHPQSVSALGGSPTEKDPR